MKTFEEFLNEEDLNDFYKILKRKNFKDKSRDFIKTKNYSLFTDLSKDEIDYLAIRSSNNANKSIKFDNDNIMKLGANKSTYYKDLISRMEKNS